MILLFFLQSVWAHSSQRLLIDRKHNEFNFGVDEYRARFLSLMVGRQSDLSVKRRFLVENFLLMAKLKITEKTCTTKPFQFLRFVWGKYDPT